MAVAHPGVREAILALVPHAPRTRHPDPNLVPAALDEHLVTALGQRHGAPPRWVAGGRASYGCAGGPPEAARRHRHEAAVGRPARRRRGHRRAQAAQRSLVCGGAGLTRSMRWLSVRRRRLQRNMTRRARPGPAPPSARRPVRRSARAAAQAGEVDEAVRHAGVVGQPHRHPGCPRRLAYPDAVVVQPVMLTHLDKRQQHHHMEPRAAAGTPAGRGGPIPGRGRTRR